MYIGNKSLFLCRFDKSLKEGLVFSRRFKKSKGFSNTGSISDARKFGRFIAGGLAVIALFVGICVTIAILTDTTPPAKGAAVVSATLAPTPDRKAEKVAPQTQEPCKNEIAAADRSKFGPFGPSLELRVNGAPGFDQKSCSSKPRTVLFQFIEENRPGHHRKAIHISGELPEGMTVTRSYPDSGPMLRIVQENADPAAYVMGYDEEGPYVEIQYNAGDTVRWHGWDIPVELTGKKRFTPQPQFWVIPGDA